MPMIMGSYGTPPQIKPYFLGETWRCGCGVFAPWIPMSFVVAGVSSEVIPTRDCGKAHDMDGHEFDNNIVTKTEASSEEF